MSAETITPPPEALESARYPEGYAPKFIAFHDANPSVAEALTDHAFRLKARGHGSVSMRYLFEHERLYGQHPDTGGPYVLDNNLCPAFTRLIEEREPSLRGFFPVRCTQEERAAAEMVRQAEKEERQAEARRRQPALMFSQEED